MAIEIAPTERRFNGQVTITDKATGKPRVLEIPRVDVRAGMRMGKIAEELVRMTGVPADTITGPTMSLSQMYQLSMKVLDAAFKDFEIENLEDPTQTGQPGRFGRLVFTELARMTGLPYDEVLSLYQEEAADIVAAIWEQEADRPFVQRALSTIQPTISLLSATFAYLTANLRAAAASLGGQLIGGEPSSSFPSPRLPEDGESETFSDSPLETPSDTSEPQPSGES